MKITYRRHAFALITVSLMLAACSSGSDSSDTTVPLVTSTTVAASSDTEGVTPITPNGLTATLSTVPASASVSSADAAGLIWMREAEKLAHDVYMTLGNVWGSNVFSNISQAENTHVSAVGTLLDRYDIKDPITSSEVGVFTDPTFTKLYGERVTFTGSITPSAARSP